MSPCPIALLVVKTETHPVERPLRFFTPYLGGQFSVLKYRVLSNLVSSPVVLAVNTRFEQSYSQPRMIVLRRSLRHSHTAWQLCSDATCGHYLLWSVPHSARRANQIDRRRTRWATWCSGCKTADKRAWCSTSAVTSYVGTGSYVSKVPKQSERTTES